jgi:hypothetical protein
VTQFVGKKYPTFSFINPLKPSGNYLYLPALTTYNSAFCPQSLGQTLLVAYPTSKPLSGNTATVFIDMNSVTTEKHPLNFSL